jgi:Uma2 family endonuclease
LRGAGKVVRSTLETLSVNLPQARPAAYTLEDWKAWEGRWELIHGVAYDMTPAPGTDHQAVSFRLGGQLFNALEAAKATSGGDCRAFAAPTDVFLDEAVVQPDLLVVCDPQKISARGIEGAPDLVVEILSPRTAGKDLTRKRWLYEAAGVPEYLIVDPDERVGLLLRLEAGIYQESARIEWGNAVALLGGQLPMLLG